jgi:hypothetical protein
LGQKRLTACLAPQAEVFADQESVPLWGQQRTHAPQQTTALFDHFVGPSEKTVEQHTIT